LNTPQVIFGLSNVSWQVQSKQQTGGLKTTYTVKASSGSEAVGCQTSGNSCILQLDTSLGTYRVSVSASNAKGSSVNLVSPTISDPLFNRQWYLNGENGINAENAWASTLGSQSITVAVIDTGVVNHKDFSDSLMLDSNNRPYGFDFVSNSASSGDGDGWDFDPTDPGDYSSSTYSSWHGTEVTGLISATHNSIGIAGLASDTQIVSVRALGKDGGTLSDFLAAINWSAGIHVPGVEDNSHPAQIINLSLAGDSNMSCDTNAQSVLNRVESAGAIVVTAAGNGSTDLANSFPSNCAGVISVASSDRGGDLESYSNFGAQLSIVAPGGDLIYGLLTTSNSGKTIAESDTYSRDFGTSFSAPLVTGTIALMLSVNPRLSKAQVIEILERSANKFKDGTRCSETDICGPGILNAAAAVELADLLNY
jgi:serine protease